MKFKLIIAFVNETKTNDVMAIAREKGATGATVIAKARGEGLHQPQKSFLGLTIDAHRDVLLFVVEANLARTILESISNTAAFDEVSGSGLAIQIDIDDAVGIVNQMESLVKVVEEEL